MAAFLPGNLMMARLFHCDGPAGGFAYPVSACFRLVTGSDEPARWAARPKRERPHFFRNRLAFTGENL